ncbi:MAG: replicative DNA helicase [Candidatus Paceibacterota bacterium]
MTEERIKKEFKERNFKDKIPPQNIEAEKSVLGCLMIDKNAIVKVADFLIPEDFYKNSHLHIYTAMLELFRRGEPIDILSLSGFLKEKGWFEEIGGHNYLTELINCVPNALHVLTYAKIVQKKRILRDLIDAAYDINDMGYNEDEDPEVLLDNAERAIFNIAQKSITKKFVPIKEALSDAFERFDKMSRHQGAMRGVPTGFREIDNLLSGLQKSDLVILAARPSLGKSSLALDIARHAAVKENVPVGIFSLEMSTDQVVDRMLAAQANVDLWRLRNGKLSGEDFQRLQIGFGELSEAPIYINDTAAMGVLQIKAMARRLQADRKLGLIVIDYLQLMQPSSSVISVVQQVSEISRSLKILARELDVPILALSQLSRAVEQRMPPIPRLSDLRESGSLEQDADIVAFIYREDKYRQNSDKKNIGTIIVAKHRNGPTGVIDLYFDAEKASYRNLVKEGMGMAPSFPTEEIAQPTPEPEMNF